MLLKLFIKWNEHFIIEKTFFKPDSKIYFSSPLIF